MSNQSRNILTTLLLLILFLSTGIMSWSLLDLVVLNDANNFFTQNSFLLKASFIIVSLIVLFIGFKQISSSLKSTSNDRSIETIIEKTSADPTEIRTAIIRLRQVLDPKHMKLAISIATLLDQLLHMLNDYQSEQDRQIQETTEITQAVDTLQSQNEQMVKAPHLRSEFLSRMGDEITLPMNSLNTMLKLLKSMEFSDEARDLLIIASHSAHSLIENLTNILEFSKLDAHLLELNKEYFDLTEAVTLVLETQESIALSKSLMLETHINPDVPEHVLADKKAVDKILSNIVSNAIRFTDRGNIKLVIDQQIIESKKMLRFTIIDTGIGIPESAIGNLFDSLDKDTDLVNSSFTGRLRLIVSKQLCELMGGEIGVRSVEGEGSQFWFTIDITA